MQHNVIPYLFSRKCIFEVWGKRVFIATEEWRNQPWG